jgi:hypothetical protein
LLYFLSATVSEMKLHVFLHLVKQISGLWSKYYWCLPYHACAYWLYGLH